MMSGLQNGAKVFTSGSTPSATAASGPSTAGTHSGAISLIHAMTTMAPITASR